MGVRDSTMRLEIGYFQRAGYLKNCQWLRHPMLHRGSIQCPFLFIPIFVSMYEIFLKIQKLINFEKLFFFVILKTENLRIFTLLHLNYVYIHIFEIQIIKIS